MKRCRRLCVKVVMPVSMVAIVWLSRSTTTVETMIVNLPMAKHHHKQNAQINQCKVIIVVFSY